MSEKKDNFILKWNDDKGQYVPIKSDADMNEGIFVELIEEEGKWRYFYIKGASLIARRTALRAANGISKTGYIHPKTNLRYGVDCKLQEEISPYEDMPSNLRKSQRSWYKGEYRQY
ncbi:MAG: hypothetical protein ACFE9C_04810 [Candidatus Hodarchaeota archaeon]